MHAVAEYDQEGHVISVLIMGHNITELKETERYLEESRAQLRIFTAKREDARAEERKRIAREVHDELGQLLSVLRLNIMTLSFHFGDTIPWLRDKTHKMTNIVDLAIMIVRNLATRLRPAVLNAGIVSALECMTREYAQNTDIKCRLHIFTHDVPLNEEQSIMVFRIVQESLTNVLRHSGAARVDIYLRRKGDVFELEVSDNGNGFEILDSVRRSSYGIAGMQERALILGGHLDIVSEPGGGTLLKLHVPLTGSLQKPQNQ
jgi:signal transduction histidine kinase